MSGLGNNQQYFSSIADKIDRMEGRIPFNGNMPEYGEPDYIENAHVVDVQIVETRGVTEYQPINDLVPQINPIKIDGVVELYKSLNQKYNLKFDAESVSNIGAVYKEITDPDKKELYEIYLREHIDRLRLVCLGQLSNTVYVLIGKLTAPEVLDSLTIAERVALLDRLFEYMDKINNMMQYVSEGDSNLELREIANREPDTGDKEVRVRNRELESKVLEILSGK